MEPMPFERNVLDQTDEELGVTLIAYWISINAIRAGIEGPDIPREFAVWLIEETASMESDSVEFAALQNIYRKACSGNLAAAGHMFRELVERNERQFDVEDLAEASIRLVEGRKKGGKKSAETRRSEAKPWHDGCVAAAKRMLAGGIRKRDLASKLARRFNVTPRQVRNVLQEAGVLEKSGS